MAVSFDYKERLGAGHFGEVWRVIDMGLNAERALKLISPTKVLNLSNIFQEAQALKSAEHPNVVKVEETGTLLDGRIYIAMEYLPKGSLEDEAKGSYVDLTRAQRIMVDALRGLQHAHEKNLVHRDIKPANILVGNHDEGKLSDFGLALPKGLNLRALGVRDYGYILHLAPEVIVRSKYSMLSDIYAAGVTLYRLVNGDSCLPAIDPAGIRRAIVDGKYPNRTRYREFIPRPLKILINRAMDVEEANRFQTAEEMRHALEQVPFHMNWNEQTLTNGIRWTSRSGNRSYEVTRITGRDKTWSVQTRKGHYGKELRRVKTLCRETLTKAKAEQMTKRILQDYVLGRLK